jgi:hypothetical protein
MILMAALAFSQMSEGYAERINQNCGEPLESLLSIKSNSVEYRAEDIATKAVEVVSLELRSFRELFRYPLNYDTNYKRNVPAVTNQMVYFYHPRCIRW